MVTETQTEYETVAREREITRCDLCGISDDETLVDGHYPLVIGPYVDQDREWIERHVTSEPHGYGEMYDSGIKTSSVHSAIDHFGVVHVCRDCLDEHFDCSDNLVSISEKLETYNYDIDSVEIPQWENGYSDAPETSFNVVETKTETEHRFGNRSVLGIGIVVGACLGAAVMVATGNVTDGSVIYPASLAVLGISIGMLFDSVRNFNNDG